MAELFSTICGLATPPGFGAIAVIRVSGKETFSIVDKIFFPKTNSEGKRQFPKRKISSFPASTLIRGEIFDPETKDLIDEVLLATYPAPNSYTGEDMVEIFCHGGFYCPEKISALLIRYGCRQALSGEFTKRRFLAGKIDLTQAEGILALTSARTELQARVALKQMKGYLSRRIRVIVEEMKDLLATIENEIEFPMTSQGGKEEETISFAQIQSRLASLLAKIKELVQKGRKEVFIQKGIRCPIIGKANVGKSSLFNRLLEKERALVTEIPGTTRDAIEETISLKGIPFHFIDTCGFRYQKGKLERLGWEKTKEYLTAADLVIVVLDHSRPLTKEDLEIMHLTANQKRVIVRNKSDLKSKWREEISPPPIPISCKEGSGIEDLKDFLAKQFLNGEEDFYLSELRHWELLKKAADTLEGVVGESYLEAIAYQLKSAINFLSEITGEVTSEEILERIFSRFCIGK